MTIILIVGPPAAGKSTLCRRFTSVWPEVSHLSFDEIYAECGDARLSWMRLAEKAKVNQPCLVENAGTSRLVDRIFLRGPLAKNVKSVLLYGSPETLKERLLKRQEEPGCILSPRAKSIEQLAVDYCSEALVERFKDARNIRTDRGSFKEVYKDFEDNLLNLLEIRRDDMSIFSNINFTWRNPKDGMVRARGTVDVAGTMSVSFSIMDGRNGLFVGLPGRYGDKLDEKTGKKVWYSDVKCCSREIQDELNTAVLAAFRQEDAGQEPQDPPDDITPPADDDIPF